MTFFSSLEERAKNIPSTDADKLSEVQHVVDALKINGYTDQFIKSCKSTTASSNRFQPNRGFVTLPYLQVISEKIARTLNHFNVNVAHKPVMTVGSILRKPKDKFSKGLSTGVIYKSGNLSDIFAKLVMFISERAFMDCKVSYKVLERSANSRRPCLSLLEIFACSFHQSINTCLCYNMWLSETLLQQFQSL